MQYIPPPRPVSAGDPGHESEGMAELVAFKDETELTKPLLDLLIV